MLIGELLSRQERFIAYGPQAVVDAWVTLVNGHAVDRDYKPPKEAEKKKEEQETLEAKYVVPPEMGPPIGEHMRANDDSYWYKAQRERRDAIAADNSPARRMPKLQKKRGARILCKMPKPSARFLPYQQPQILLC